MSKLFIRIVVLVCLGVAIWTGYSFFHGGGTVVNGVILIVDIGVLIWNFSIMRKMRIGLGSIILTGILLAVIVVPVMAFAGMEPLASYKNKVLNYAESIQIKQEEQTKLWTPESGAPPDLAEVHELGKQQELARTRRMVNAWEFTLNSYTIRGTDVSINLTVTSHYNSIRDYFLSSPGTLGVVDQYEGEFYDVTRREAWPATFYTGRYYPGESKTGSLKLVVNPRSGKISLLLTTSPRTVYTLRYKLFDLGEVR